MSIPYDGDIGPDEVVIYTSQERGSLYNCIRLIWCGCCEPYHIITDKWVKENKWESCSQKTNSMSMEAISDVTRDQGCCCCLGGCFCGCICNDFATITIHGQDKSQKGKEVWNLRKVANSKSVHTKLTKHIQQLHQEWRKHGRNLGQKLQQVKQDLHS